MNSQERKQFYPVESMNSRSRTEQRWEDDANIYGDISSEWQISIGNGKRLNRRWKKCGGFTIVRDSRGIEHSIYSERHDREWQQAIDELRPPRGLTRQTAMPRFDNNEYDRSLQPDDDPDFYSYPIQRSYANY